MWQPVEFIVNLLSMLFGILSVDIDINRIFEWASHLFDQLGYKKEKIIRGYASRSEVQRVFSGPTKSENPDFILGNFWPSVIPFMTVKHTLYLNVCSLLPNHWDPKILWEKKLLKIHFWVKKLQRQKLFLFWCLMI